MGRLRSRNLKGETMSIIDAAAVWVAFWIVVVVGTEIATRIAEGRDN